MIWSDTLSTEKQTTLVIYYRGMAVILDHEAERGRFIEIQEGCFTRWCNTALYRRGSPLIDDIFVGMLDKDGLPFCWFIFLPILFQ